MSDIKFLFSITILPPYYFYTLPLHVDPYVKEKNTLRQR